MYYSTLDIPIPQDNPEIAAIYLILLDLFLYYLVPGGGVEPPRPCDRRILSPLRLPVPPSRRILILSACSLISTTDQALRLGRTHARLPLLLYLALRPQPAQLACTRNRVQGRKLQIIRRHP